MSPATRKSSRKLSEETSPTKSWIDNPLSKKTPSKKSSPKGNNVDKTPSPVGISPAGSDNTASSYEDVETLCDESKVRWKKTNSARRKSRRRSSLLSAKKARSAQKALKAEANAAATLYATMTEGSLSAVSSPTVQSPAAASCATAGTTAGNSTKLGFSKPRKMTAIRSSLLLPTACSSVKQRGKSVSLAKQQQKTQARKGAEQKGFTAPRMLTKPQSPQLQVEKRLRAAAKEPQLSSEELMMQKLQEEKIRSQLEVQKAQRMYQTLRSKSVCSSSSSVHRVDGGGPPTARSHGCGTAVPFMPLSASKQVRNGRSRIAGSTRARSTSQSSAMRRKSLEGIAKRYGSSMAAFGRASTGTTNMMKKGKKPSTAAAAPRAPTVVQPFKFASSVRSGGRGSAATGAVNGNSNNARSIPTAELAARFMRDTRSHEVPAHAAEKLTLAHSPKLLTRTRCDAAARSKAAPTPTQVQREELDLAEMRTHAFKARPLDRRIFESMGELGVPKVEARAPTDPMEFHLQTDLRGMEHRQRQQAERQQESASSPNNKAFKARPMPEYIKDASKAPAIPPKVEFTPTDAHSPKLHGGRRASSAPTHRQRPHHSQVELEKHQQQKQLQQGLSQPLKVTQPVPFELQTSGRGALYQQQLLEQLQREEAELAALREQRAHPVPDYAQQASVGLNPHAQSRPLTEPQPFHLQSEGRHSAAQAQFQQQIEQLKKEHQEFHARPLPHSTYEPQQVVHKSSQAKELLLPANVELESERRARMRKEFDTQTMQRMAELEQLKQQLQQQQDAEEERRVRIMRRKSVQEGGMTFKAAPIIEKDQFPTRRAPSPRPLTEAHSPDLQTQYRSKSLPSNGATAAAGGVSGAMMQAAEKKLRQQQQFKARPLNRRIFESTGDLGVPKVAARPLTAAKGPVFETERRSAAHKQMQLQRASSGSAGNGNASRPAAVRTKTAASRVSAAAPAAAVSGRAISTGARSTGGLTSGARRVPTSTSAPEGVENSPSQAPPTVNARSLRSAIRAKVVAEKTTLMQCQVQQGEGATTNEREISEGYDDVCAVGMMTPKPAVLTAATAAAEEQHISPMGRELATALSAL